MPHRIRTLNSSEFFVMESNKQESSTESLHAPYSDVFVSQPKVKISKYTLSFSKQQLLPFYIFFFYALLH